MATVFLCSPYNSQMFTTCCEVAICDNQDKCPRCAEEVTPKGHKARWMRAFGEQERNLKRVQEQVK